MNTASPEHTFCDWGEQAGHALLALLWRVPLIALLALMNAAQWAILVVVAPVAFLLSVGAVVLGFVMHAPIHPWAMLALSGACLGVYAGAVCLSATVVRVLAAE